jgi:hypothetical protein
MVEYPDIDDAQGVFQAQRDQFVRLARLGHPRRMVMRHALQYSMALIVMQ